MDKHPASTTERVRKAAGPAQPRPAQPAPAHTAAPNAARQTAHLLADLLAEAAHPLGHLETQPALAVDDDADEVEHGVRAAAERAEDGEHGDGPQDEGEVEVVADAALAVGLGDGHGKNGVGDEPREHHVRAHALVVVLLHLGLGEGLGGDLDAVAEVAQRLVVARVDVELLRGHLELDAVALADGAAEVRLHDVVALGAPGDVVGVAEGVDLEGADVGGQEHEVLARRGEHVPGVEVEEGHDEVEADGGEGRDDEVREDVLAEVDIRVVLLLELPHDDEDCGKGRVDHDDAVGDHAEHVQFLGALRTVAEGEDELCADEQHAGVPEEGEDVETNVVTEGVYCRVGETAGDEVEGEVEVCQGEVGEHELQELVDEFDVEEDLAGEGVVGGPDLLEVDEGVDGSEKGTVQPTTSLRDELRNSVYGVR